MEQRVVCIGIVIMVRMAGVLGGAEGTLILPVITTVFGDLSSVLGGLEKLEDEVVLGFIGEGEAVDVNQNLIVLRRAFTEEH